MPGLQDTILTCASSLTTWRDRCHDLGQPSLHGIHAIHTRHALMRCQTQLIVSTDVLFLQCPGAPAAAMMMPMGLQHLHTHTHTHTHARTHTSGMASIKVVCLPVRPPIIQTFFPSSSLIHALPVPHTCSICTHLRTLCTSKMYARIYMYDMLHVS
jgi:hypothetical protein